MPSLPVPSLMKDADSTTDTRMLYLHSSKKVFIQRDYGEGLEVRFDTAFPLAFRAMISQDTWESTIAGINLIFAEAEHVGCASIMETLIGCFTCYCSRLVARTIYEKKLDDLERFLEQQNNDVYNPANLHILNPMERGLRVIEIVLLGTHQYGHRHENQPVANRGSTS